MKVHGQWTYLCRALDKHGETIDFHLSPTRNAKAAKRFLGKALSGLKAWEKPDIINTDKAPTYAIAISRIVEHAFGLGTSGLTEAVTLMGESLKLQTA